MEVERFTVSYAKTNEHFQFQFPSNDRIDTDSTFFGLLCVLKNLLQRGNPVRPSVYLQKTIKTPPQDELYPCMIMDDSIPVWDNVIRGGLKSNPALDFYNKIPLYFGDEYPFLHRLTIPEAKLTDIISDAENDFIGQQVDFYIPAAKLVIEIDGLQHQDVIQKQKDKKRDDYLRQQGFVVHRIPVAVFSPANQNDLNRHVNAIKSRLKYYKDTLTGILNKKDIEFNPYFTNRLHLDLIIRYELLIVSLLQRGILYLHEDNWKFSLLGDSDSEELFKIAINDVMEWLEHLCAMAMIPWQKPELYFCDDKGAVQIDCNLFRFPDSSSCIKENKTIFIRNDPYIDRDWFKLSLAKPISYEIGKVNIKSVNHDHLNFFLENIFGYKKFQTGQLPIIKEALSLSDTIGILPTSGGKSLCYQLACLLQPCVNFVICPLVSLCHDQKYNLDLFNITRTAEITSNIQTEKKHQAIKDLENGRFLFVWITPERFQSAEFRRNICENNKLHFCYAVLDEVHCLSEWGHDFRTAYLLLVRTLHKLVPETCLIGLTATISSFVLLDLMREFQIDISRILKSKNLDRNNLRFEVDIVPENKREDTELFGLLNSIQKNYRDSIFSANSKDPFGGIIFCNNATGKNNSADSVYKLLQSKYKGDMGVYHSKIEDKDQVQQKFIENKLRILTATKAFGMGVNKKNIRYTIHYGLPQSIEDFYQEAGRAGRDQKEALCTIIYHQEPLQNKRIIEECFGINTSADRVFQLKDNFCFDLKRVFYLLSKNYKGTEKDYLSTCSLLDEIQSPQNTNSVLKFINDESTHNDVYPFSKTDTEKALYRLMILGIVDDWTIEYNASLISLQWRNISCDEIKNNFINYLKRYDSEKKYEDFSDLSEGVRNSLISSQNIRSYIEALIIWQYENIYYQRRMSIKNMMDLCEEYYFSPEDFKEQICDFLTVNTVTDDLDVIADEPWNIRKWFKILKTPRRKKGTKISYSEIVRSCERYLESYQALTGLDFVYSVSCAMCNMKTEEAQIRFRLAITSIYNYFLKEQIEKIHEGLFDIVKDADKDSKWWIREILIELRPELEEFFCKKISID